MTFPLPERGSLGERLAAIWRHACETLNIPAEVGTSDARACFGALCRAVVGEGRANTRSIRVEDALRLAALRLQAGLADRWGLRGALSPPDDLPGDPIHAWLPGDHLPESLPRELAIRGWHAAAQAPFRGVLEAALEATSRMVLAASCAEIADPSWMAAVAPHPLRLGTGDADKFCLGCAWNRKGRCLQVSAPWGGSFRVPRGCVACARWEPGLTDSDCASCGACCREGYSMAPVRRGEAMIHAHPEWIEGKGVSASLPRPDGRCVALSGDGSASAPWRCRDYAVRPRACSGLAVGSIGCLDARRRTGLSAG